MRIIDPASDYSAAGAFFFGEGTCRFRAVNYPYFPRGEGNITTRSFGAKRVLTVSFVEHLYISALQ